MIRYFLLFVVAVALAAPQPASAAFTVTLSQTGFASQVITDGSAPDVSPTTGLIVFSGLSYGTYSIDVDASSSNSTLLDLPARIRSNVTLHNTTSSAALLTITVTDTNFQVPPVGQATLRTTLSLTADGGVSSNVATTGIAQGHPLALLAVLNGGGFRDDTVGFQLGSNPYTISVVTAVSETTANLTLQPNAIAEVTNATPAPASAVLALASLPMIGLFGWLRRRRQSLDIAGSVA
jgi:hypothetical protein